MDTVWIAAIVVALVVVAGIALALRRRAGDVVTVRAAHTAPLAAASADLDTVTRVARDLLASGNKIEAVRQVRALTGWGLKEAKNYVDALQAGLIPPVPPGPAGSAPLAAPPADLDAAVRELLARGQKIQAIKLVRQHTGLGLKEAKDYVDAVEGR